MPNGSISFQLNVDATVLAAPYGFVAANPPVVFQFDEDGNILPLPGMAAAQIWSNAELNPQNDIGLGTYYLVTFYDANGAQINKLPLWFQFTEDAGATVDLGQMVPFSTVGGNVIFYPTSFVIGPPGPDTLGGVFSNVGVAHQWVSAINTNGSVTLSQPSFADISGTLAADQLPSPLTFNTITATGLITGEDNIQLGLSGTTTGAITFEGGTSGTATLTAPAVAGTVGNPFTLSNSLNIPTAGVFAINGDTGISRASAGVLDVGNGTAGNASGTLTAATLNAATTLNVGTSKFIVSSAGLITTYAGITTTKLGVGAVVASSLLTAQSAAIAATTVYAIPTAQSGLYRITYVATVTTADSVSSALGGATGFQVKFTNANGDAVVKTSNPTTPNITSGSPQTTGASISGTVTGYAAASSNLQYLFGYTSNTPGDMIYDLAIYVEYLG